MIIYIKQTKKPKLIYKTLSIFKTDTIEDKTIIYLPINNKTRKKKTEKVMEKLSQFFYEKAIKNAINTYKIEKLDNKKAELLEKQQTPGLSKEEEIKIIEEISKIIIEKKMIK